MAEPVDLSRVPGTGGVVWSWSPGELHTNLVVLDPAGSIGEHRNDELDVLVVVLAGAGTATVDDEQIELAPATGLTIPRGTTRSITAGLEGIRYLTIHAARGPLTIGGPR